MLSLQIQKGFEHRQKPRRWSSFTGRIDINEISGPILLEQYRAVADFTKTESNQLTIVAGQQLEVIEKLENGWWFVSDEEGERGWVPGVYLVKPDGESENLVTKQAEPGHGEKYITTSQFTGEKDDISFGAGVLVEVLQKNLEGWWRISYQGKEGWAPASYLEKPADAVLRQSNRNNLSINKTLTENRRSFPGNIQHSVCSQVTAESTTSSSSSAPTQRKHFQLTKTNSNPSNLSKELVKTNISKPKLNRVRPPPKKSSLNRNSIVVKPQKPPPLPPPPKTNTESVYEYFTTESFSADIPHGISFEKDKKVEVIEKSPGGWWYITIGDKEGWAPASHVKKIFSNHKTKSPPERPKLPSALKKTAQPGKTDKEAINRIEQQKKSNGVTSTKPVTTIKTNPKPITPSVKPLNSNVTTSKSIPDASPKFDFKSVLNKAAQNHNNVQADKLSPVAKKLPAKPIPITNKSKSKSTHIPPNNIHQKKPISPPARPLNNLKKPVVSSKKPSQITLENKNGQVDFRSVLKSSSNASKPPVKNLNTNNKRPSIPRKPLIPNKPGISNTNAAAPREKKPVSFNRTKFEINFQTSPTGKSPKPVLSRFQQNETSHNQNRNNNNKSKDVSKNNSVFKNRVEVVIPHIASNNLRGTLVERADDVIISDVKSQHLKLPSKGKTSENLETSQDFYSNSAFVAVDDYHPENPSEIGFSKGDVATLLDKSDIHWWYVSINENVGWVPCSYFENRENSAVLNSESSNSADDEPVYSEIHENPALTNGDELEVDLYRVMCDYTGSDDSTVSVGKGDTVRLVDQTNDWCFVRIAGSQTEYINAEGWLPSHCLQL